METKYDRFTITRNGVSKAVILSPEEFEGLLETLDILTREAITRAKKQVKARKTVSLRSIKDRYGLK